MAMGLSAALAACLAIVRLWGSHGLCLDDAFIHLSYAKSLRLGDGLSYNPGDHETGFSSPLWVLLLSVWPWGDDPVRAVKWLGVALHALLACGSVQLTRRMLGSSSPGAAPVAETDARPLVAGLLVACDPFLVFSSGSGMEVTLTALLLVWTLERTLAARTKLSFVLGAACVWARPECLFVLFAWSGLRWLEARRASRTAPALGALFALAVWCEYCLAVTGYPWPNTYYAKRNADLLLGLRYVIAQVLPEHAWAFGVSGLGLLVLGAVQRRTTRQLVLAWLAALLAIAGSRELAFGPAFYNSRYFAILGALPIVAMACALPTRALWRGLVLAPIVVATLYLSPRSAAQQRAQEDDIDTLHVEPAHWLAHTLPAQARVAVEGAGAVRFYTPRSMRIVDVVGLNDARVVHAGSPLAAVCLVLRQRPTDVLLPDDRVGAFQQTLQLQLLRTFVDDDFTISLLHATRRVYAAHVRAISSAGKSLCHL